MSSILTGSTIFRKTWPTVAVLGMSGWLAAMLLAAPAVAQDAPPVAEGHDEALARDAGEYARRYDLAPEQASRELRAQVDTVPVTDALAREFSGRLVGIAIERVPELRIAVLLTGDEPVSPRTAASGDLSVPIVFRTGAPASHSALISAITRHQATMRARLSRPPGIGLDARTGEMLVLVSGSDTGEARRAALATEFAALTGVPVRVEAAGDAENMMVAGGARVVGAAASGRRALCTGGFAVTDGTRFGVATAAHCPDALSMQGADRTAIDLPFVTQAGWGYQDVQVNESPVPLEPVFFADTGKTRVRAVQDTLARASTRAGDFVCHRGERTGYSCAEVLLTDFAPAGDLCGGACLPTWVAVEGPTCRGGDSGAPVFRGTTVLGLVKGGTYRPDGSCAMYYYMSVDYLPTGWSLLRQAPPLGVAP